MSIETIIVEYKETSRSFFAYCDSCFDINEETGDPQNGSLQLSGDGVKSLGEAEGQVKKHLRSFPNHRTRIGCV
jgi:hypothetical protein